MSKRNSRSPQTQTAGLDSGPPEDREKGLEERTESLASAARPVAIAEIRTIPQMRQAARLQKRTAEWEDHTLPVVQLVASQELGGVLLGAFDGEVLIGFVYGLPGFEGGHRVLHSHMLVVEPAYRNLDVAYRLKLAQRERVIADGADTITWTFDPLQSVNAHLNLNKLGVDVESYRIDFYGPETSSFLHRHIGTDRFWVAWHLKSRRVRTRLGAPHVETSRTAQAPGSAVLVRQAPDGRPEPSPALAWAGASDLRIEIPADIGRWQRDDPEVAKSWRAETRRAFGEALAAGYRVEDFHRGASHGVYELRRDADPSTRGTGRGGAA